MSLFTVIFSFLPSPFQSPQEENKNAHKQLKCQTQGGESANILAPLHFDFFFFFKSGSSQLFLLHLLFPVQILSALCSHFSFQIVPVSHQTTYCKQKNNLVFHNYNIFHKPVTTVIVLCSCRHQPPGGSNYTNFYVHFPQIGITELM